MTVEEIEIIVTAKVEEALKEFEKFLPAIKKVMKQAQEAFSKVNMKEFNNKVKQSAVQVKRQIEDIKKATKNNEISIKVNNKDAKKTISQTQRALDSLKKQTTSRMESRRYFRYKNIWIKRTNKRCIKRDY